ncbi:hypothetical protein [Streptomyces uncialis]|uniref:hypothetical protein n=1 Tax=Streptomyces uncialis TaxID=1048205 RepID=UPI0038678F84|nr:hypothetical protein OG924_12575 [Streptomyces uncialis]
MRVRMRATLSGTRDGVPWPPRGGTVDLPDDEAQHLLRAGLAAEAAHDETEIEEATAPAPETAAPSRRRTAPK